MRAIKFLFLVFFLFISCKSQDKEVVILGIEPSFPVKIIIHTKDIEVADSIKITAFIPQKIFIENNTNSLLKFSHFSYVGPKGSKIVLTDIDKDGNIVFLPGTKIPRKQSLIFDIYLSMRSNYQKVIMK